MLECAVVSGTLYRASTIGPPKSTCLEGVAPGNDVDSLAQWSFGFHQGLDLLILHWEH